MSQNELLRRKQELRMRIGRTRRRIDARLRGARDQAEQLLSWRTYVVRYPAGALAAALGAGLSASALLKPARVARWLGLALVHNAWGGLQRQLWVEAKKIWTDSTPQR